MAKIQAEIIGHLDVLIERLRSGRAPAYDQQWAAELLEKFPPPKRVTGRNAGWWRDWGIYHQVCDLLAEGRTREEAYKEAARRFETLYSYQAAQESQRTLSAERVKAIYLQKAAFEDSE